jgi:2-polyprenyl-3-methyl-5-hydroxy-6-metoxy-1,4-benzoquinol methylase
MTRSIFESIKCNLCGSGNSLVVYPSFRGSSVEIESDEFRSSGDEMLRDPLVKCNDCGFQYVTPRIHSELALEEYTNAIDETFVSQAKGRELTFKRCLKEVESAWKEKPGSVLDVGTANGSFLKVAKDGGWVVEGCEPNKWMCKWCWDNYGIEINQGTVFDGNYDNEKFDVVTLWDVLEHTANAMATLKECARVLRPGGLVVVNYPDIGSWIARLMGRKWVFLLSVHYFYFTKKTIRHAFKESGFDIVRVKPHFQSLEMDYVIERATPYIGGLGNTLRKISNGIGLGKTQIPYWVGQTLVIGKKRGEDS